MPSVVFRQLDSAGNVLLDLTQRTFLTLADVPTIGGQAGSVTVPQVGGNIVWSLMNSGEMPMVSRNGNVVSWSGGGGNGRLRVLAF